MAVAWLFEDERSNASDAALRRVTSDGAFVPSLWRLEIANMLRNAIRRRRCDDAYADGSLAALSRLPIEIDQETDSHAWGATHTLSREEGLTPYDAAYLELALRRRLALASNDKDLLAAARRRDVAVISA